MGDIDDLKKLSPSQRMEKLKEIEERNKKEIEEARKLMTESLREIEVEDEIKRDMPIPQLASVDVDSLFTSEEKEIFKTKRFISDRKTDADEDLGKKAGVREIKKESSLEESIEKEKLKELPPNIVEQYTKKLEEMSSRVNELKGMEEDRFQKYKTHYEEELKSMYANIERMMHYESLNEQIHEMNLNEQIGSMLGGYRKRTDL